jgi:hypothetical protein
MREAPHSKDQKLKQARAALRWALEYGVSATDSGYYSAYGRMTNIPKEIAPELRSARLALARRRGA